MRAAKSPSRNAGCEVAAIKKDGDLTVAALFPLPADAGETDYAARRTVRRTTRRAAGFFAEEVFFD
jgi:hypothetical protein